MFFKPIGVYENVEKRAWAKRAKSKGTNAFAKGKSLWGSMFEPAPQPKRRAKVRLRIRIFSFDDKDHDVKAKLLHVCVPCFGIEWILLRNI